MNKSTRIILTFGVVAAMVYFIDWHEFGYVFAQINWQLLIPLVIFQAIARLIDAYQLTVVIRLLNRSVRMARVFLANALAVFYGFILPGEILATAPKWMILSKDAGSRADILNAIVYNRLALMMPPLLIGGLALASIGLFDAGWKNDLLYAPVLGVVIVSILLLSRRTGTAVLRFLAFLASTLPAPMRKSSKTVLTSFSQFHRLKLRSHMYVYLLSTASSLIRIIGFVGAAYIVKVDVPATSLALAYAMVFVLGSLPLTLGNIGVREGILVFILARYGAITEQSILLGMVLYVEYVLFAIIGGAFQVMLSSGKGAVKDEQP